MPKCFVVCLEESKAQHDKQDGSSIRTMRTTLTSTGAPYNIFRKYDKLKTFRDTVWHRNKTQKWPSLAQTEQRRRSFRQSNHISLHYVCSYPLQSCARVTFSLVMLVRERHAPTALYIIRSLRHASTFFT